jgi:ATP-binding cassette, subfamily F, member 3
MLRLIDVAAARGVRTLYKNVSLTAPPGERIGLVGANGSGKSTLFALILGELAPESGRIEAPPAARIAHVAQDIEASGESALDYVLAGHAPLMAARAELARAETEDDDLRLSIAHAQLAELNEGAIVARAATVLSGLGFAQSDLARTVTEFSGGWRNRLALARALLRPADLLLLDEPTNHLDLDSVIWLEAWLRRQPATALLISHDREFLDRCATVTWNIADGTIRRYAGNYSAFELAWAEQQRQQDAAARTYQRTAAHLQSFVDRFRAKATKARQAQSRIKMLERLAAVEPARAGRDWRFEFPEPRKLPERLLDAEDLRLAYGPRTILDGVRFLIRSGDRIGILGVNGAGKSTLVRALPASWHPPAANCAAATAWPSGTSRSTSWTSCARTKRRCSTCAGRQRKPTRRRASRSCAIFSASTASAARWRRARSAPCQAARRRAARWRCSPGADRTCCCSTNRPTIWTWRRARR